MKRRITAVQARAFVTRWQVANAAEIEELRNTSLAAKLRQLETLRLSADAFAPNTRSETEREKVRQRWMRLRKAYGV
jgi:hypothetical protein